MNSICQKLVEQLRSANERSGFWQETAWAHVLTRISEKKSPLVSKKVRFEKRNLDFLADIFLHCLEKIINTTTKEKNIFQANKNNWIE